MPCTFPHLTQRQAEEHPFPLARQGHFDLFAPSLHEKISRSPFRDELCPHLHVIGLVGVVVMGLAAFELQQLLQMQRLVQAVPLLAQGQDARPLTFAAWQDAAAPRDLFLPHEQPLVVDRVAKSCSI